MPEVAPEQNPDVHTGGEAVVERQKDQRVIGLAAGEELVAEDPVDRIGTVECGFGELVDHIVPVGDRQTEGRQHLFDAVGTGCGHAVGPVLVDEVGDEAPVDPAGVVAIDGESSPLLPVAHDVAAEAHRPGDAALHEAESQSGKRTGTPPNSNQRAAPSAPAAKPPTWLYM